MKCPNCGEEVKVSLAPNKELTYPEQLQEIDKKAGGVDNWPEWKKSSIRAMRFGESFDRD